MTPFFGVDAYKRIVNRLVSRNINWLETIVLLASLTAITVFFLFINLPTNKLKYSSNSFHHSTIGESVEVFGLGISDFNNDKYLDVFTVNHAFSSVFLENQKNGYFNDRFLKTGLHGRNNFPGANENLNSPQKTSPGIYIYWHNGALHIETSSFAPSQPLKILMELSPGSLPKPHGEARLISHKKNQYKNNQFIDLIDFSIKDSGRLIVESLRWQPFGKIHLPKTIDLETVFIGYTKITPSSHTIDLSYGSDRHGVAWSDFNADGFIDAAMINGGEVGLMKERRVYPLALGKGRAFKNIATETGLVQSYCPSRQIVLTDVDHDDAADIYVVCGRGQPPRNHHPNELFLRKGKLSFDNKASAFGLDFQELGNAKWFDSDNDGKLELLWVTANKITILKRNNDTYESIFDYSHHGKLMQATIGAIDNNAYPDTFLAYKNGDSLVLLNDGLNFRIASPDSLGLPRTALCANFVDINNDGVEELHTLPQGVFVRNPAGAFKATGQLSSNFGGRTPLCQWFDADNDGDRDLLIAIKKKGSLAERTFIKVRKKWERKTYRGQERERVFRPEIHQIDLYTNEHTGANWLALDLHGFDLNSQAIGARAKIRVNGRTQIRSVGHAEASKTSMGHYRVYFGLDKADKVDDLTVYWADGSVSAFGPVSINQLLKIDQANHNLTGQITKTAIAAPYTY